MFTTVI